MVDDTSQQPVQDNPQISEASVSASTNVSEDQSSPASPSPEDGQIPPRPPARQAKWPSENEASQSISVGQQPDTTWLNTPNLANSDLSPSSSAQTEKLETLPSQESDSTKLAKESEDAKPNLTEASQVEEKVEPEAVRPESLEMATQEQTPPATQVSPGKVSSPSERPESPNLAFEPVQSKSSDISISTSTQSSPVSDDSNQTPVQAEKPVSTSIPDDLPLSPRSPPSPQLDSSADLSAETLAKEEALAKEDQSAKSDQLSTPPLADTNVQLPSNQPSQVQSDVPSDASISDSNQTPSQSSEIKPEPPHGSQEAQITPIEPPKPALPAEASAKEGQKSFGDLLEDEKQPPSIPSSPSIPSTPLNSSNSPLTSPTPLPIDLSAETSVKEEASAKEGISPQSAQSDQLVQEPMVIKKVAEKVVEKPVDKIVEVVKEIPVEKVVEKEIKVADEDEIKKRISDHILSEQQNRRILANQARSRRKSKNFDKIMVLARNTQNISNEDIQRLLHVSQSTATNYLSELTKNGMLKREGIRGGTKYSV